MKNRRTILYTYECTYSESEIYNKPRIFKINFVPLYHHSDSFSPTVLHVSIVVSNESNKDIGNSPLCLARTKTYWVFDSKYCLGY